MGISGKAAGSAGQGQQQMAEGKVGQWAWEHGLEHGTNRGLEIIDADIVIDPSRGDV